MNIDHDSVKKQLVQCYINRQNITSIEDKFQGASLNQAYQIQEHFLQQLQNQFKAHTIGKKVGVTSPSALKNFNLNEPLHGSILNIFEGKINDTYDYSTFMNPKIEVEVAFIIKKKITENLSIAKLIQAIDFVTVAYEVVDFLISPNTSSAFDLLSENIGCNRVVLGHSFKKPEQVDFNQLQMQLQNHHTIIAEGSGKTCYGSPLNSLYWLTNTITNGGGFIDSGETIITGSLCPLIPIENNSSLTASLSQLGNITIHFE